VKSKPTHTIASLLANVTQQLEQTSTSAALDAELLLAFCIQKDRSYLLAWTEVVPSVKQQTHFQQLIKKREVVLEGSEDLILPLYAKGMSVRDCL